MNMWIEKIGVDLFLTKKLEPSWLPSSFLND